MLTGLLVAVNATTQEKIDSFYSEYGEFKGDIEQEVDTLDEDLATFSEQSEKQIKEVSTKITEVEKKSEEKLGALEEHMSDVATWTRPEGGLFIWVTLQEGIHTREMFTQAIERKVAYVPGEAFAVHGDHVNTMRLSFCNLTTEQIHEAIRRLSEIVHRLM